MARTVGIGKQNFEDIITKNIFYIDKTMFIKEWWENEDDVSLWGKAKPKVSSQSSLPVHEGLRASRGARNG